eukprot:scaffold14195_cov155-Skeletonema_dohrnii-CCMP3373.AAC.9
MFNTPKTTKNEVHSTCPSPPRPNRNFVSLRSVGLPLPLPSSSSDLRPSSVLHRRPAPLLSLSRQSTSSTSTFSSLASDIPSLTLTYDDEDDKSSSSSSDNEQGFFRSTPAVARPIFQSGPVAVRNDNIVNIVPQGRYPVIRLQPRRSSS